jgi:hypothetical protein
MMAEAHVAERSGSSRFREPIFSLSIGILAALLLQSLPNILGDLEMKRLALAVD